MFEDYLFQAQIISQAADYMAKQYPDVNPYYAASVHDEMANWMGQRLREMIDREFDGKFQGKKVTIGDFRMPWNRIHELHFSMKLD